MKRFIFALLLLATPAVAQPQMLTGPSASEQAADLMLDRERAGHKSDLAVAVQLQHENEALKKQIADDKAAADDRTKKAAEAAGLAQKTAIDKAVAEAKAADAAILKQRVDELTAEHSAHPEAPK